MPKRFTEVACAATSTRHAALSLKCDLMLMLAAWPNRNPPSGNGGCCYPGRGSWRVPMTCLCKAVSGSKQPHVHNESGDKERHQRYSGM